MVVGSAINANALRADTIIHIDPNIGAPYYYDQYNNKVWVTFSTNQVMHFGARHGYSSDLFGVLNRLMDEVNDLKVELELLKPKLPPPPEPIKNVDLAQRIETDLPREI